jgi:hypothetical protein
MTLKVCACADGIATVITAQSSASAKAVRRKLLCKIDVQGCAGFVMVVSCAGCDGWRQRFSIFALYTQIGAHFKESDYFSRRAI